MLQKCQLLSPSLSSSSAPRIQWCWRRGKCNAVQWKTSWGSTESSSGHDATQQPVTRLHWGETSPSLSSGFSNWFLHREGLGKLTIWNGHRKNETRKCSSKAEWTRLSEGQLITFDRSVITADHRAQHTPRVHIENAAAKFLGKCFWVQFGFH